MASEASLRFGTAGFLLPAPRPGSGRFQVLSMKSKFRWRDLLRALREVRGSGWVICETPAVEEDALRLQRFYRRIA